MGKDPNVIVSGGDGIQRRDINLDDLHKPLFERYEFKYGLSEGR